MYCLVSLQFVVFINLGETFTADRFWDQHPMLLSMKRLNGSEARGVREWE